MILVQITQTSTKDMDTATTNTSFAHLQDLIGSLPILRTYIPLCLCFKLDETTATSQVEGTLTSALAKLADAFPFLAGRVVIEGINEGNSGVPKIVPHDTSIGLLINDVRQDASVPTSTELSKTHYPAKALNQDKLLSSLVRDAYPADPNIAAPVFQMEANFIRGGLLLMAVGNHHIMDATGLGLIIELLAKALRGEAFTELERRQINQPRGAAIPLLGEDYQPGPELDDVIVIPADAGQPSKPSFPPHQWGYFRLTAASLRRLKFDASHQDIAPYISTDDAIGALCWQAVSRIRQEHLGENVSTKFARPVNVRKWFGLKGYVGQMVDSFYTQALDVHKLPLGTVAGRLRQTLQQDEKIKFHVRALATLCHRLDDKSHIAWGAQDDLRRDLLVSSWTGIGTCDFSYGDLLGVPEASRCPSRSASIPIMLIMPKDKDGSIVIAVGFSENEMNKLREDEEFLSYAEFVG